MDLSFSSMFFHDCTLEEIARVPREAGTDSCEFWLETPDFWLNGLDESRLSSVFSKNPLHSPLSLHAPVLDLNPCSINPDVAAVSVTWIERSIGMASRLGAQVCTIHPGRRTARRPPTITDYRRLGAMLDRIEEPAGSLGIRVAIENMEPQVNALLTTPEELGAILDERPWLWCTIDACHVRDAGAGQLDEFFSMTDGRVANVHISGGDRQKMHRQVTGDAWGETALNVLADSGYRGLVTLEINDLVVDSTMNYREKVAVIRREIDYIRGFLS